MSYLVGRRVVVQIACRTRAKAPVDPTTLTCRVLPPGGPEDVVALGDAALQRVALGDFELTLTLDRPGRWLVRVETTGTIVQASELAIPVYDSLLSGN